ncbi:MAG TPA: hypothetical protein VF729_07590 [Solirubrobacterales bacterium]
MSRRRREVAISTGAARRRSLAVALLAAAGAALPAAPAGAAVGYELDPVAPTVSLGANKVPHGLAVDQANRRLYVAVLFGDVTTLGPGEVRRFESDGTPAGTFTAGGNAYFGGVAVDPATQGFFAAETKFESQLGTVGTRQMDPFTAAGAMGTPFPLNNADASPNIAIDSGSNIYYPSNTTNTVQVLDSTGTVEEEIACTGCPGGAFGLPVSVAVGSDDDLYVVDLNPNRVLKFVLSAGSYVYSSTLLTGGGAAAVAVDRTNDDVFVGALPGGINYHVLAFDSSGVQFDDFGGELVPSPPAPFDSRAAFQMAVDETSRELYLGTLGSVYVFDRLANATPPSVTATAASAIDHDSATLNTTVNAKGHTVLECEFEYVEQAEFEANGFDDSVALPCSRKPGGTSNVSIKASASGLSPVTQYRYRTTATSYAGTTVSGQATFTTTEAPPPPPPPTDPVTPPPVEPTPETTPPPPVIAAPALTCRKGFTKKWVGGKYTCVKRCPKGTIRRRVQGKYKCVKRPRPRRANRRPPARADRR